MQIWSSVPPISPITAHGMRRIEPVEGVAAPTGPVKIGAAFTPKPQEKTPLLGADQGNKWVLDQLDATQRLLEAIMSDSSQLRQYREIAAQDVPRSLGVSIKA